MYGGYTAAALALRAKSSISYDCVPSSSSYYSTELALNPRLLLYNGYLLRQSSLLYWSPSRSLLAGRSRLWPTWSAKESWRWRRCPSLSVEIKCCDCDRTRCERSCLGANFGEFEQSSSYLEEKGRRVCDCDRFRSERSKLEADRGEFRRTRSKLEENRSGSCSACGSELSRASRDGRGRVVRREVREIWEYDDEKDAAFRVSDRRGREDYDYKDDYKVVKRRDGRERESRLRNNVDARKKKKVDRRVVRRSEDSEEEAELLIDSAREGGEEYDYEEQNVVGRRYSEEDSQVGRRYSEEDSRRSRRASEWNVGREENLSSRVKRQSNVGRREAERRFDLAHAERDDFAHEEEQLVRRESRERSRKDTRASQVQEDDRNWASSSNSKVDARQVDKRVNFTSSNQKIAGRNEEKKSTQKIKEISEVHDGNVERASHFERLYEEMRAKNREDTSSSVQNYVQMRGDKRSVIDQEVVDEKEVNISKSKIDVTKVDSQVNKGSALKHNQTESRRSSQNLTEISLAKNSNIESVSNSQNHYEETRAKERESSSTSVQNSFQVTGDRRSQINQQVIDNSQLSMQNITRTDVSSSNKSDTMIVKSSQNILDTKIDNRVFSTTVVNIGHEQMGQQEYLRTNAERNSQVSGFGRSKTERWDNSQEVCNRRIEDERVKRQYSLRGESERDSNVSHYLSDAERVSDYKEMSDSRRENRRGSTLVMVEEQDAKGGTRQQLKAKMTFTGSSGTSSSSRQTDEFDSRAKRDETHLVRNDALESATQLERSSASYVGEFVDKLQQEMSTSDGKYYSSEGRSETQIGGLHRRTSQAATAAQSSTLDAMTKHRDDNYMEEGAKRSSRSGVKGPSDEMWDVKSATSQETFRSSDREEASSPTGAADLTTLTGTETVHARRSSKSLWNYVADIVKLGWISHSESRDSAKKSGKRSSSNDSVGSEGWFSGQEQGEDDETSRKGDTTTPQEPVLIKRPIEQSYPSTPAGPSQGSSVVPRMRGEVTISEVSTTASVDIINEGFLAPSASSVFSPEHVQRIESENPIAQSSVVTIDQSSIVKDDKSSPTIAEISGSANVQVPLGSYVKQTVISGSANVQVPLGSYVKQTEIPGSGNVQVPSGSYVKQTELSSGANVQVPLGSYVKQTEIPGSGNVQVPSGSYVKQTELSSGANVQVPLGSYVKQTEISGSANVQVPSSSYVKQTEISGSANVQVPSSSYVKQTELSSSANPLGSYVKQTENPIIEEPPELVRIEGTDAELKRRKFQRNKQVLRESFDGWEEAYKRESEQRKLDEFFMREALEEAQRAADTWEVPVGAVLVRNGEIVARGCNLVEELRDSTAHAEMICIREASNHLRTWRLAETTLYVTLEPCAMCAGAILQARIDTVVWGAPNKLLGADGSWVKLFPGDGENSNADLSSQTAGPVHPFHSKIRIRRGVLATECSEIMQQFFQLRRKKKKQPEPLPPPPPPPPPRFSVSSHPIKFFTKLPGFFSVFCL